MYLGTTKASGILFDINKIELFPISKLFTLETLLELLAFSIDEIEETIPLYTNSASSVNIIKGSLSCEDDNE